MKKIMERKTKKSKPKLKINKKRLIVIILVLIAIVCSIAIGIRWLYITIKYSEYEEKMYTYGLADLYDNKKATSTQKVTNDEMLKIVIAAITGKTDIDAISYMVDVEQQYKWLEFAKSGKYIDGIDESNIKKRAKKIDTILLISNLAERYLSVKAEMANLKMSNSSLAKLTADEKQIIAKAVSMEIIENENSSISDKEILKGELNKLVATVIEKYATLYYNALKYNENGILERQDVNIVTDVAKMPKNYKEYPYIIDSIPNEIYEYEYKILTRKNSQTPKIAYKYMGALYGQIDERLVDYFNKILNIDYTKITSKSFLESIQGSVVYKLTEDDVKQYVDYVKANKIILKGQAEPLLPIIYNNGEQYVVRTKLTFEVLNSNTEYNLLFGDEQNKVKYNGKQIIMYVDVPMGMTLNSWSLRVYVDCFARHKLENTRSVVVE